MYGHSCGYLENLLHVRAQPLRILPRAADSVVRHHTRAVRARRDAVGPGTGSRDLSRFPSGTPVNADRPRTAPPVSISRHHVGAQEP